MEINQENIEKVSEVLRMEKFTEALSKVSNISELAKQLIEQYPELTPEEIGERYEEQLQKEANNKDAELNVEEK